MMTHLKSNRGGMGMTYLKCGGGEACPGHSSVTGADWRPFTRLSRETAFTCGRPELTGSVVQRCGLG